MIRCVFYSKQSTLSGGIELLQQLNADSDNCLWIDIQNEDSDVETELLIDQLNFNPNSVIDAKKNRHPPKSEAFADYIFILLKASIAENVEDFKNCQFALFVKNNLLVTRHEQPIDSIDKLFQQDVEHLFIQPVSGFELSLRVINALSTDYGDSLLRLEARLSEIEDDLFTASGDKLVEELMSYSTQLKKIKRILAYQVGVLAQIKKTKFAKDGSFDTFEFTTTHELMERFFSLSDLYEQVVKDLVDGFISLTGHRLNNIMKVLTVVTVIFVPLTLLVGIYGMNFENMPELKSANGYYLLLSAMAFISISLLFLFRRKKWI